MHEWGSISFSMFFICKYVKCFSFYYHPHPLYKFANENYFQMIKPILGLCDFPLSDLFTIYTILKLPKMESNSYVWARRRNLKLMAGYTTLLIPLSTVTM